MAFLSDSYKEMARSFKDTTTDFGAQWTARAARARKWTTSAANSLISTVTFKREPKETKTHAKSGPKSIEVEATAETIETNNVIEETPKGETTPLTAGPETSVNENTAVTSSTTNIPAIVKDNDEEEQSTSIVPPPTSGTAAPPPSFRERVVAVSRRGMEKVEEAYATARAKLRLTKALFGKTKPAAAVGTAAGGEVGEGAGAAAASELPAEGGAVLLEEAGDETSPAAAAKTTRGFWARKARWASKRCTEAKEKVGSGVTAAKQGAKGQLQALKKSFSRKRNSSQ